LIPVSAFAIRWDIRPVDGSTSSRGNGSLMVP